MSKSKRIHCLVASNAPRLLVLVRTTQSTSAGWWVDTESLHIVGELAWNVRVRPAHSDFSPDGEFAFIAFRHKSDPRESHIFAWGDGEPRLSWKRGYGRPIAGYFPSSRVIALKVNFERHSMAWAGALDSLKLEFPIGSASVGHLLWPVVAPAAFDQAPLEYIVDDPPIRDNRRWLRGGWSETEKNLWTKTHSGSGHTLTRRFTGYPHYGSPDAFSWDGPSRLAPGGTTHMDFDSQGSLITAGHGLVRVARFEEGRWRLAAEWSMGFPSGAFA